ncbi:MAG: glycoside hydrolase family 97 protein [Phycisphaerae bacterium]
MRKSLIAAALLSSTPAFAQTPGANLASPDGHFAIHFQTLDVKNAPTPFGQLTYTITRDDNPIFSPSQLQLQLTDGPPLGKNVRITGIQFDAHNATYHLPAGKASTISDHYNATTLNLEEPGAPQRKFSIEARAYDDAIAFRYLIPQQPALQKFQLAAEHTRFQPVKDAIAWSLLLPNFHSMYESEFIPLPLSALCNQGGVHSDLLLGCPCLIDIPAVTPDHKEIWCNITEANLRGYSAMYLTNPSTEWGGHFLESKISPHPDNPDLAVEGDLPHTSPWRVIQVADSPAKLIDSNILTSLNPATKIPDTSWIHPGKSSWNWWNGSIGPDGKSAFNTDTMKFFVDFSAHSGFEYMLIDAGWAKPIDPKSRHADITQMNGKVDIPAVVQYAKSKNVRVWIWLSYTDAASQMKQAFPLFEKWGVAGCKIDFIERNDQAAIQWYYDVAQLAAQHHLMLDFHGCTTPTGLEREFPNVLGYEAVTGMEQSKAGLRDNPAHHLTLPFTRMLAGPMDYTPGSFHNVTRAQYEPVMDRPVTIGTRAHQLAMYPIYFAPFQMVSDNPQAYENAPEFQFIKDCPAAWDETRGIAGTPGEFAVIARRKGTDWFLGAMTNDSPRHLDIPLTFLPTGNYKATLYTDALDAAQNPTHVTITTKSVTNTTTLPLAPAGGAALKLTLAP